MRAATNLSRLRARLRDARSSPASGGSSIAVIADEVAWKLDRPPKHTQRIAGIDVAGAVDVADGNRAIDEEPDSTLQYALRVGGHDGAVVGRISADLLKMAPPRTAVAVIDVAVVAAFA